MPRFLFCTFSIFILSLSQTASADLMIDIEDAFVVYDKQGFVNARITGSDSFNFATYQFRITPVGGGSGSGLDYVNNQTLVENETTNDSSYVFTGSTGFSSFTVSDPTLQIEDGGTGSLNPGNDLLVRFAVQHDLNGQTGLATVGDQFTIDVDFAIIQGGMGGITTTTSSGTVTVTNPEPSSLLSLGVVGTAFGYIRRRRARAPA